MLEKIKKWNGALFIVVFCTCLIGGLLNKSFVKIEEGLLFGAICGLIFGIPMAILTRDE
jgi:hypothetical protein